MARILTLYDRLPPEPDGGADFVVRLGRELARLGHEHALLVPPGRGADKCWTPGSEVIETQAPWDAVTLGALPSILETIREWEADVVHLVYPWKTPRSYPIAYALLRRRQIPGTLTVFPAGLRGRSLEEWRGLLRALHSADTVVVSAPEQRAWLIAILPWLRGKIECIPSGGSVPTDSRALVDRSAARRRLQFDQDRVYLGHFGYLYRGKRIDDLISACGVLAREGLVFELLLIGGQGLEMRQGEMGAANPFVASLRDQINALGLSRRVSTTGFLEPEQAEDFLTACDAIVFPARRFGLGRSTTVAALALGVPLIAPRVRPMWSVRDVTQWGNVALYSPGRGGSDLVSVLRRFLTEPNLRQHMRAIAAEMAPLWSWRSLGGRYEGALTRPLRVGRGHGP